MPMLRMCGALLLPLWHVTWAQGKHILISWGGGGVLIWYGSGVAEEAVFNFHETLSAEFIQIIVNRRVFGHTLSCSLQSKVVCDFYVTELQL